MVIEIKRGNIIKELFSRDGIAGYLLEVEGREEKCVSYPDLVGEIEPGDEVLVNTTAVSLNLGSGGYHFVIANLNSKGKKIKCGGHIMKLRYTPMQVKVLSVEEEESPHHQDMAEAESLEKTPVLVATLHSMLAPLCLQLSKNGLKVVYVMTDGAALPLFFSHTVHWLKANGILQGTVTTGHAFGGDLEAVNIYSGLLAAKRVYDADVIIVSMGPGIVGTGTRWGFSGIEQGEILNAVEALEGLPIAVPRISFADERERHRGISHHTITVLSKVCRVQALVPLPVMEEEKMSYVLEQLRCEEDLLERYKFCLENVPSIIELVQDCELPITTMKRAAEEDKEFFLTLGAAAAVAQRLKNGEPLRQIRLI